MTTVEWRLKPFGLGEWIKFDITIKFDKLCCAGLTVAKHGFRRQALDPELQHEKLHGGMALYFGFWWKGQWIISDAMTIFR